MLILWNLKRDDCMEKMKGNMLEEITIIEKEENGEHSRFVWSCGCITIMDGDKFTIYPCSEGCPVISHGKQVAEYYNIQHINIVAKYKKPLFEEQNGMEFPTQIMEKFNSNSRFCLQCSGCHGCR